MERAQLSTAQGKERPQLVAARRRLHLSQEEVAERLGVSKVTVHRWEKEGGIPQPIHLRELCTLFGVSARELGFTAQELGFEETAEDGESGAQEQVEKQEDALAVFRRECLTARLLGMTWNWPRNDARYHPLQAAIIAELEENMDITPDDFVSRRDAVRLMALVPIDILGLSRTGAVFKSAYSHEDILIHCAAGIVACWYLRRGKDLVFADQAVTEYLPTLKAIVKCSPETQRKAAADLLAQALLLKTALSWAITTPQDGIGYAQQAEYYASIAGSRLLRVAALRAKAAALSYANRWGQALQAAEQAKCLLEEKQKASVLQPAEAPISYMVSSYVYSGLAVYQAYHGRKDDALLSLRKAKATFFERPANEETPILTDHHVGNLLENEGEAHMHLGKYRQALDSLEQIDEKYADDATINLTCRINSLINQVLTEANRDDKPRRMDFCVERWKQAIEGAKEVKSNKLFDEAVQAYTAMRGAWPAEQEVKDLRGRIVHW
jgi:transcriptional regulator with XRE-family HTH domain